MDPAVLAQCLKRVVMVRVSGPDYTRIKILGRPFYHADNGVTTLSASGLLVDEKKGIIITSATLLSPFMNFNARRGAKDNKSFPKALKKDTAVHVLFEESAQRHQFARDESDVAVSDTSQWRAVSLIDVVPCQLVDACLKQLTGLSLNGQPGWEVGWHVTSRDTPAGTVSPHDVQAAQSCWRGFDHVAVLQLSEGDRLAWLDAHEWTALKLANMERCERGEAMTMIGSPFGIISPPIFTNSTFQATVSNVIRHSRPDQSTNQQAPCLLMLDQLCLPGCEGGPVFNQLGELVGLIAPPLRKNDNSNVEVNLVIAVNSFVSQLYEQHVHVPPPPSPPAAVANPVVEMIKSVQKSVALITVGAYWGSGILVSAEGYILTCAHLFRSLLVHNAPLSELKIDAAKEQDILSKFGKSLSTGQASPPKSKSYQYDPFNPQLQPGYKVEVRLDLLDSAQQYVHKWYAAELKYVSSSHWDLALLKLKNFVPSELNVTIEPISIPDFESDECKEPQQGESIFVLGHGLFGPSKQMLPMSLNGIVSKIVYLRGKAQIIETSARVHRGVSGGILTNKQGQFIGLVTSNARQKDGRIVPNINFSIPARHLRAISEYLSGAEEELTALQSFEVRDEECAALWKLRLTAPHNITDDAVKPLFPPNLNSLPPPAAINSPESVAPRPPSNFYNFIARFEEQMAKPSSDLAPLMSNTNTPVNTAPNNHNTTASIALKQPSISDLIKSKL